MSLLLNVENLGIGYQKTPLVENLNIKLSKGEHLQIIGGNGCGKTTLIKTLLGEIPPLSGKCSTYFKNPYYLEQHYQKNIHLPLTVKEILGPHHKDLNISPHLKWNDLSGGQKQQVLIKKAFTKNHDLIIFDEPLNHLDQQAITNTKSLLENEMKKKTQLSFITVSHIPLLFNAPTQKVHL